MECREMVPIVYGLAKLYENCLTWERVNFHETTPWHDLIYPLASPEFALLDSSREIIYRWFGYTEKEEFTAKIDPLCKE
jgi:hypothetical protein